MGNNFRKYHTISAPSLTQPNYGSGIAQQFKNIENNFSILASADFAKGDRGISVKTVNEVLAKDGKFTEVGARVINEVMKYKLGITKPGVSLQSPVKAGESITGIKQSEFASFTKAGVSHHALANLKDAMFKIVCTYDPTNPTMANEALHALNTVIIKDDRFAYTGEMEDAERNNFIDMSCTVALENVYNDGTYTIQIVDNLSCLWYNADVAEFCWVINGTRTSIPARGIPGKDGVSGRLYTFKADRPKQETPETTVAAVPLTHILTDTGWVDIATFKQEHTDEYGEFRVNQSCVVHIEASGTSEEDDHIVLFTSLQSVKGTPTAFYDTALSIPQGISESAVCNIFAKAGDNSMYKGLFNPAKGVADITSYVSSDVQHWIYSGSNDSSNTQGRTVLFMSPCTGENITRTRNITNANETSSSTFFRPDFLLRLDYNTQISGDLRTFGSLAVDKDITVKGTSTFNGPATFNGRSYMNGVLQIDATDIQSTVNHAPATPALRVMNGSTQLKELTVANGATINGTLYVGGATSINNKLTVNSAATFKDEIRVDKNAQFNSISCVSNDIEFVSFFPKLVYRGGNNSKWTIDNSSAITAGRNVYRTLGYIKGYIKTYHPRGIALFCNCAADVFGWDNNVPCPPSTADFSARGPLKPFDSITVDNFLNYKTFEKGNSGDPNGADFYIPNDLFNGAGYLPGEDIYVNIVIPVVRQYSGQDGWKDDEQVSTKAIYGVINDTDRSSNNSLWSPDTQYDFDGNLFGQGMKFGNIIPNYANTIMAFIIIKLRLTIIDDHYVTYALGIDHTNSPTQYIKPRAWALASYAASYFNSSVDGYDTSNPTSNPAKPQIHTKEVTQLMLATDIHKVNISGAGSESDIAGINNCLLSHNE